MKSKTTAKPRIVSQDKWLAARIEFLREEKEFTKQRDRLSARRRELPWVKVEKDYTFESPRGPVSLGDMFEGRSQLIVYHFMLGPGWEEGCRSCSYVSDHFDGCLPHLNARDVSFTAISRAPLDEIERFKARMGWKFNWVSSNGSSFNFDFHVSFTEEEMKKGVAEYNFTEVELPYEELPGFSVFARDAKGAVYRTYSTYGRGFDIMMNTYNFLDIVPKGRDEDPEATMSWVRHHDQYEHSEVAG